MSVCTLCVHRTADSCCRVHQSAAVFIGWWPRNTNSCITEGQRQKVRQRGHRAPDLFTTLLFSSTCAWNDSGTYLMRNCLSAQDLQQHPVGASKAEGRHVGHVHSSTKEDKVCLANKTFFLKCHCFKWYSVPSMLPYSTVMDMLVEQQQIMDYSHSLLTVKKNSDDDH